MCHSSRHGFHQDQGYRSERTVADAACALAPLPESGCRRRSQHSYSLKRYTSGRSRMTDRFILLPSFISEREPSKYRLQAPRARPKCCRTHAHNPAFLPTHIQCVAVTATTTHMIQVRKAIQTLRRKESPSAPRPGISIALNGSLKGACFLPALSRTLMRMSFTTPVAAQKKLAKPTSALIRKSALNIWINGGVVTGATPFRQGPTGCFRHGYSRPEQPA